MGREIVIAALGPDDGSLLTLGSLEAMRSAERLVLRTERHAAADFLRREGVAFDTLDALYGESEDFEELAEAACARLLSEAGKARLCYAVSEPSSDQTVLQLAKRLPEGWTMTVNAGVSLAENAACAALCAGVDTENLRRITALSLEGFRPQADAPLAVTEIDGRTLASEVKLWLSDLYDDETTVYFLENAAEAHCRAVAIPLYALDRQAHYDHRTAVVIPAVPYMQRQRATYEDLVQVVGRLRGPGGCPWDREQTFSTLRRYMIEEACEAADAMDGGAPEKIADELGDVLLQVVLNSRIGAEHRAFTDRDVTTAITRKMIARHPHVFGDVHVDSAGEVRGVWEEAKAKERGRQSAKERMAEVPEALPGLMRAQKVCKRQLQASGKAMDAGEQTEAALCRLRGGIWTEQDLGEVLEEICLLAEALGLDAETALRAATARRIEKA